MRRSVVMGVAVLVIGVALVVGGAVGALSSLTINRNFTQPHPGEYVSAEIILNSTSDLVVRSPVSAGGVIPAQDLDLVNSTNIGAYVIPPSNSGAGSDIYTSLSGDYYYVAFASAQPGTTIVATPSGSGLFAYAALVLLGIILVIAAAVYLIVSALRRRKAPVREQT